MTAPTTPRFNLVALPVGGGWQAALYDYTEHKSVWYGRVWGFYGAKEKALEEGRVELHKRESVSHVDA